MESALLAAQVGVALVSVVLAYLAVAGGFAWLWGWDSRASSHDRDNEAKANLSAFLGILAAIPVAVGWIHFFATRYGG
jgi:hypothetical protein